MPPQTPFPISGKVYDVQGSALNAATVQVTNLRTGESLSTTTNSSGEFILELANAVTEYANNDKLLLRAFKKTNDILKYVEVETVVNTTDGSIEKDLYLIPRKPAGVENLGEGDILYRGFDPLSQSQRVSLDTDKQLITLIDYDGGTNATYVGEAFPGSSQSHTIWRIKKLTYDANNNATHVQWATGNSNFNKSWSNRTTYVYF